MQDRAAARAGSRCRWGAAPRRGHEAADHHPGCDREASWCPLPSPRSPRSPAVSLAQRLAQLLQALKVMEKLGGGGGSRRITYGHEDPRGSRRSVDERGCDRRRRGSSRPSAVTRHVTVRSRRRLRSGHVAWPRSGVSSRRTLLCSARSSKGGSWTMIQVGGATARASARPAG